MKLAGQKGLPGQKGDRPKKEAIYDLSKLKNITVKLIGGREVKGTLVGYDALQNLVIENCTCNGVLLGLVVVRGTATFMITGEEPKVIDNPF